MIWEKWSERAICKQDCIWLTQTERGKERKRGRKEKERRDEGKEERREEEGRKKEGNFILIP